MGKLNLWFKKKEILNKKLGLGQTPPPPLLGLCPKFFRFFIVTPPLQWKSNGPAWFRGF